MSSSAYATIFDLQRFAVHDGPGIRTVVFFKGCAMRCAWCHNPEGVQLAPEIAYYADRCLPDCRACLAVCPARALRDERDYRVEFSRCTVCGRCVDVCPANALQMVGRQVTCGELLAEVGRDRTFYAASGGGLTLSGGEPVLQSAFLREFLPAARAQRFHVTLETAGCYPFRLLEPLLADLDLVLFDVKLMDSAAHRRWTDQDTDVIHANLRELCRRRIALQVRMPLLPGINTGADNVVATARLLAELGINELTLLPYNHYWEAKLPRLAALAQPLGITADDSLGRDLARAFARCGITTVGAAV
jgi:pyruvate formate lyase activating enzyme